MKFDRQFVTLFLGRILQAAIALAGVRILTEILNRDEVGLTYLVATLASYFSLIFINPICMYMYRRLHEWLREDKLRKAVRLLNLYFLAVAILSIPVVSFCYFVFEIGNSFTVVQICLLVTLNVFATNWFLNTTTTLNMIEKRTVFVGLNVLNNLLTLAGSLAFIFLFQKTAFWWLFGLLFGQVVGCITAYFYFRIHVPIGMSKFPAVKAALFNKQLLYFSIPIGITTALMWTQNQSYRIVVENKFGAETLALFGVGLGVSASIAGLVESIVTQYFYPQYYNLISTANIQNRTEAWRSLYRNAMAVYVPSMVYVFCLSESLLRILVSPKFANSVNIVMFGAFIEFFRMSVNILYAVSQSEMKTRSTIAPYAVGAAAVLLGLTAVSYIGGDAVTIVPAILAGTGAVVFLTMYQCMKKVLPISLEIGFLLRAVAYSMPFTAMFALRGFGNAIWMHLAMVGSCGIYLLFVFWKLMHEVPTTKI